METCTNISELHPSDQFICSNCGLHLEGYFRVTIEDGDRYEWEYNHKYCPECRRKVVN